MFQRFNQDCPDLLEKDQGNLGQNLGAKNSSSVAEGEIRIQTMGQQEPRGSFKVDAV